MIKFILTFAEFTDNAPGYCKTAWILFWISNLCEETVDNVLNIYHNQYLANDLP